MFSGSFLLLGLLLLQVLFAGALPFSFVCGLLHLGLIGKRFSLPLSLRRLLGIELVRDGTHRLRLPIRDEIENELTSESDLVNIEVPSSFDLDDASLAEVSQLAFADCPVAELGVGVHVILYLVFVEEFCLRNEVIILDKAQFEDMPCAEWSRESANYYLSAAPRSRHFGGVVAAAMDGHVQFLPDDIDDILMALLISINDGRNSNIEELTR